MFFKLPTAWLQLRHQKTRLLIALTGVVFAVVIIFIQLGLWASLLQGAASLPQSIEGDCFLISPRANNLLGSNNITARRLSQILAFEEVEFAAPVYISYTQFKNTENPRSWPYILLMGFDLRYPIFNLPGVKDNLDKLKLPDTLLFDRKSLPQYGPVETQFQEQGTVLTEVKSGSSRRSIEVVGLYDLGTSFAFEGTSITSSINFMRITNQQQKGLINIGAIKLKPGTELDAFMEKVERSLPQDIKILSREKFIKFEQDYWNKSTPVGFVFQLGSFMGLLVGTIIVYQILYTNVSEHLAQYATLKAIGYQHRYLLSMVLQQSIFIAVLGYIPGWLLSQLLYGFTKQATQLPIGMNLERSAGVFVLTLIMCFFAGATAVRKLKDADPADIF
jgi:putative ABC transport system permease protein